jgi:hypothetical protein
MLLQQRFVFQIKWGLKARLLEELDIWKSEVEWREGHGEMWVHQFMTLYISLLLLFSV